MKIRLISIVLFTVIGVSIYYDTFQVPFHFDDYTWIVDNDDVHIKGLSYEAVYRVLAVERPVPMLSFALNHYWGGSDVFLYHLVNLAIHIITAYGLFLFLQLTLSGLQYPKEKAFLVSLLASLFWLSNPLQTQAVSYIVQRMTGLGAMFYIYSIYFYARARLSSHRAFYLTLCVLTALLAFGSKQNTFALPLFIFIYEAFVIRREKLDFIRKKEFYLSLALLLLLFLIIAAALYPEFRALFSPYTGMVYVIKERALTQARVLFIYISLFLLPMPSRLSIEHDLVLSRSLFEPQSTLFAVAGIAIILTYCAVNIKKRPFFAFFALWYLGNSALESFYVGIAMIYEHRAYLPSLGLAAIMSGWVVEVIHERRHHWYLLPAVIILTFSVHAYKRNHVWNDPVTLWSDAVRKAPFSAISRANLGISYLNKGMMDEGIEELKRAKSLNPRDPYVRYHLGVAFFTYKMYDKALDEFRAVWKTGLDSPVGKPTIDDYFLKIARSFMAHGHVEKGRELLMEAGSLHPENVKIADLLKKINEGSLKGEDLMPEGW